MPLKHDENFKLDVQWLLKKIPNATENQIEAFTERVAIMTIDACMCEEDARVEAHQLLTKQNKIVSWD